MAQIRTLQRSWRNGMKSDYSPEQMPPDSALDILNMILDHGAPIRVRGGWQNWKAAGLASSIQAGIYAQFASTAGAANAKNLAIDGGGELWDITTAGGGSSVTGTGFTALAQNPVFHGGTAASAATAFYTGLVIIPSGTGGSAPKKYNGTAVSNLGGTPPNALFATVYKDYTVLGNGVAASETRPDRIWFSPPGDPDVAVSGAVTAWDVANSFIDFTFNVAGLAATKNALVVFGRERVARIRGSTPPPEEDMVVDDPMWDVGLLDAFSIVQYQDSVYWAAPEGVFRTDGVVLDDLTLKGGMLRRWRQFVDAAAGGQFAAGVIRDHLVVTVASAPVAVNRTGFLINLQTNAWVRLSNFDARAYWLGRDGERDELFWGRADDDVVATLDDIFATTSSSALKNDGDGDAVLTTLNSSFYTLGGPGQKSIRRVYIGHELIDFATDNPSVSIGVALTPEATTYDLVLTALSETNSGGAGSENSEYSRVRRDVGRRAPAIGFSLKKSGAGDFILWDLGLEYHELEQSRLAQ